MRIIQIGLGSRAGIWLEAIQQLAETELAACVEIDHAIINTQVQRYGLNPALIFSTLGEALAQVEADAVIDVTPPAVHRAVATTAFNAGLPVLAEKPLADTYENAQAIVEQAQTANVLYMVAQNYRYSPAIQTLKQALPVMGTISGVHVSFRKAIRFGGYREEMAYPLIVDMSIHHFDLMRYLLNSDPLLIAGQSWNPPWSWFKGDTAAALTVRFANEAVLTYHGSWVATGQETTWNGHWRFDCEKGVVLFENDIVTVQRFTGVEKQRHTYTEPEIVPQVMMPLDGVPYLLQAFYDAVTQGTEPETSGRDNIRSIGMVFDAIRAFETNQPVQRKSSN